MIWLELLLPPAPPPRPWRSRSREAFGRYVTEAEIRRRRERLADYDFDDRGNR